MAPIALAVTAAISTAPAATSFVLRARGLRVGGVRSMSISMAVLNASAQRTSPRGQHEHPPFDAGDLEVPCERNRDREDEQLDPRIVG